MTVVVIVLQTVLGLLYVITGGLKIGRHPHMVDELAKMRIPYGAGLLAAAAEIVSGPALPTEDPWLRM